VHASVLRNRRGPLCLRRLGEDREARDYKRFTLQPLAATLGAELTGVDLHTPLSSELHEELDAALLEWKVLVFRNQALSPDQLSAVARHWGEIWDDQLIPTPEQQHAPDVVRFHRDAEVKGFENTWHCDGTFRDRPTLGTLLRAVELPALGGDTLFADMAAAFDNLDAVLQQEIMGLRAEHDWADTYGWKLDPETFARVREALPVVEHPVVRRHPVTGRSTLFVNRAFTQRILGLSDLESERLVLFLTEQASIPEYQCRIRWEPDSIVFWDNRAVQHYGVSDYHPARRVLERVTIAGEAPR
jgi:taurine dioxygenase